MNDQALRSRQFNSNVPRPSGKHRLMASRSNLGSLTKEPPLEKLDATIQAIRPGMRYDALLDFAAGNTHPTAPGLIAKRFLLLDETGTTIVYDRFLSLANTEPLDSPRVRKVMYLVWALRDHRIRDFIVQRVAGKDGKWRVSSLTRKANADFFEQWLAASSAKKVRSNIEFFLQEAGIYDPAKGEIHLELEDGWLLDAMQVAAQHEADPAARAAMTAAPIDFVLSRGWAGLLNATVDELAKVYDETPPPVSEPLEDESIELLPGPDRSRQWTVKERTTKPRKSGTVVVFNHVAMERATKAHQLLESLLAGTAVAQKYEPRQNENIDMFFETRAGMVLAEMKSCHKNNLHGQIRRGVGQLLEYRYFYRDMLGPDVTMVLVTEIGPPQGEKSWLVEFLSSLGITLVWKETNGTRLMTGATVPDSLRDLVVPS
jgi:hypothetical protein